MTATARASARRPTAPADLGPKAKKIWREITRDFELNIVELRILEDYCREVDLIERLQDAVARGQLTVSGSMGQPVANELIKEIRQHRALLPRLVSALNLPAEEGDEAGRATAGAREMARKRWGMTG